MELPVCRVWYSTRLSLNVDIAKTGQLKPFHIPAAALTRVKAHPGIWEKLERAEYPLVYASPEILLNAKARSRRSCVRNKFSDA